MTVKKKVLSGLRPEIKKGAGGNGKMKSKTIVTTETIEPSEVDLPEASNYSDSDDLRDFAGYDRSLHEYIETGGGAKSFTAKLYKYDNMSKTKQYLCDTRSDEMLSQEDVGMMFGSGDYRYLVLFPDSPKLDPKAFKFNLHSIYDQKREKAGLVSPVDTRQQKGGILESLEIMEKFATIMKSIAPPVTVSAPQAQGPEIMAGMFSMMQELMKKSFRDNMEFMSEIAKEKRELIDNSETEDEPERAGNMLDTVLPIIERFIPIILGNNPQSAAAVAVAKSMPEVKKLMGDKRQLKDAIQLLDKKLGKQETDEVLKKFGVSRAG